MPKRVVGYLYKTVKCCGPAITQYRGHARATPARQRCAIPASPGQIGVFNVFHAGRSPHRAGCATLPRRAALGENEEGREFGISSRATLMNNIQGGPYDGPREG